MFIVASFCRRGKETNCITDNLQINQNNNCLKEIHVCHGDLNVLGLKLPQIKTKYLYQTQNSYTEH